MNASMAAKCVATAAFLSEVRVLPQWKPIDYYVDNPGIELVRSTDMDTAQLTDRVQHLEERLMNTDDSCAIGIRASVPDFMIESWQQSLDGEAGSALDLGISFLHPAPLVLRVNTTRTSQTMLRESLHEVGYAVREHSQLDNALVLDERADVLHSDMYVHGAFEVQDAGSQVITHALAPATQWHVLDACAGGGGKTIHIADLRHDSGSIVATDTEAAKLLGLRRRAERLELGSIETHTVPPQGELGRILGCTLFDAVLVDAPCSGSGTARRNPLVKWKLTPKTLLRLAAIQLDILERNAALLRPGGVLLYSTCSILRTENRDVVDLFLSRHPEFVPESLSTAFEEAGLSDLLYPTTTFDITLEPMLLDSDAYYIAKFRRIE